MNKKHIIFYTIFSFFFSNILFAKENIPNPNSDDSNALRVVAAGCLPATAMTNLNVNNVTTLIMTGGDMVGFKMMGFTKSKSEVTNIRCLQVHYGLVV